MITSMRKPITGMLRGMAGVISFLAWRANLPADPPSPAAPVFFDDFSYASTSEMEAHGWTVRTAPGWPGTENATWRKNDVTFPADPSKPGKRILRMTSSTDGTPAHTFQTEIYQQRKFKEGTYAARVHFATGPASGPAGDGVVQSFFTSSTGDISSESNYSECDFEYLPEGGWGLKNPGLFVTSWRTADAPKENTYNIIPTEESGWHVLMLQVADGHVRYFLDGSMIADHSGRYYPREIMSFNFNLWFMQEKVAPSRQVRSYEEDIDWVYFEKGAVLSPGEVEHRVEALRKAGIARQDTVEPAAPSAGATRGGSSPVPG